MFWIPLSIFWLVGALLVGLMGRVRYIGFLPAFIISLVIGPVVGCIITLFSKRRTVLRRMMENQEEMYRHQYAYMNRSEQQVASPQGVADELLKLKQLLDTGAITSAEYQSQKNRLLQQ